MAVKLQVKQGLYTDLPALDEGEFGWCTDTEQLFIGAAGGNVEIGTAGSVAQHEMVDSIHVDSGLTAGQVIRASAAATFAWAQLQHSDLGGVGVSDHHTEFTPTQHDARDHSAVAGTFGLGELLTKAHSELTGVGANDHHNQVHVLAGADHTAAALTVGNVIRATGATTFAWAQLQHGDLGGVGASDHHVKYTDADAIAAAEGAAFTSLDADTFRNDGDIDIDAYNAAAATTVYIKNSDATYAAGLNVEGGAVLGGDLTLNGTDPIIQFAVGDYLRYLADTYGFYIGNAMKMSLDASKLYVQTTDGISLASTNRRLTFDANDYLQYAADKYTFYIGGAAKAALDTADLDLAVNIDFTGGGHLIKNGVTDMEVRFNDGTADRFLDIANVGLGAAGLKINGIVAISAANGISGGTF